MANNIDDEANVAKFFDFLRKSKKNSEPEKSEEKVPIPQDEDALPQVSETGADDKSTTSKSTDYNADAVGDALFDFVQGLKGKTLSESMWAPKGRASRSALPSSWAMPPEGSDSRPTTPKALTQVGANRPKSTSHSSSQENLATGKIHASTQTEAVLVASLIQDEKVRQTYLQQLQTQAKGSKSLPGDDVKASLSTQPKEVPPMKSQGTHNQDAIQASTAAWPPIHSTSHQRKHKGGETASRKPTKTTTSSPENTVTITTTSPQGKRISGDTGPGTQLVQEEGRNRMEGNDSSESELEESEIPKPGRKPSATVKSVASSSKAHKPVNGNAKPAAIEKPKVKSSVPVIPSLNNLAGFDPTKYGKPKTQRTYTAEDRTDQIYFKSWGTAEPRDRLAAQVRTVTLTRLPRFATPEFVASLVFGGALEDIHMRGDNVADVRFLNGDDCQRYAEKTEAGIIINKGVKGKEDIILTYIGKDVNVVGGKLKEWIDQGRTRCVKAVGVERDIKMEKLQRLAASKSGGLLDRIEDYKNEGGHRVVIFHFAKIDNAVTFAASLKRHDDWETCNVVHSADPCADATAPRGGTLVSQVHRRETSGGNAEKPNVGENGTNGEKPATAEQSTKGAKLACEDLVPARDYGVFGFVSDTR